MGIHVDEIEETKKVRRERMQCDKCKTICSSIRDSVGWVVIARLEIHTHAGVPHLGGSDPLKQLHLCAGCWPLFEAFVNETNIVRAVPSEVAAELEALRADRMAYQNLEEQLRLTLDGAGIAAIRVREGGGPEDLGASVAVTIGALMRKKATVA